MGPPYPPPEPKYLDFSVLDAAPRVVTPIDLAAQAPDEERMLGQAVVVLLVNAEGRVDDVIIESSGLPPEFIALAVRAFRNAELSPGLKNGVPVSSRARIEIRSTYPVDAAGGARRQ
jgi:TonB family protein